MPADIVIGATAPIPSPQQTMETTHGHLKQLLTLSQLVFLSFEVKAAILLQ